MLLVKTKIGPSEIHGLGLFAAEDVAAGTLVWRWDEGLDLAWPSLEVLPEPFRAYVLHYGFRWDGLQRLAVDNARFVNHSDDPNTVEDGATMRARRQITSGEEITENYLESDPDYFSRGE
jgi:hypothetical protein